jgi:DNA-binding XRE family transcriptional regulator
MKKNKTIINIAERYRELGLNRTSFSKQIGLSLRTVENIEDKNSASSENLLKFKEFFNLEKIDDLFEQIEIEDDNPIDYFLDGYKRAEDKGIDLSDKSKSEALAHYLHFIKKEGYLEE